MGDVVNLNRARKKKQREAARTQADANAIKFGQRREEREAAKARDDLEVRRLDGAKRARCEDRDNAPGEPSADASRGSEQDED